MSIPNKYINVNISTLTIIKVLVVFLLLYFLFLVRDIVLILFISLVFASAINPWVNAMQKKKIPRPVGMLLIYLALAIIISSIIYLIVPPIVTQIGDLAKNFPFYLGKLSSYFSTLKGYTNQYESLGGVSTALDSLKTTLSDSASGVFTTVTGIFGGIFTFFLILVITFYMVVEENSMKKIIWSTVPLAHQPYALKLIGRMQEKIGRWLTGQLILCSIVGITSFLGLYILGVKYALMLGLVAFAAQFIPYIGPLLGGIPAVFLAFSQSHLLAVFVIIYYYAFHFLESSILVPKVMQKAVGLNPIVSIAAILIGFQLAGVVGAILSIPVATSINMVVHDLFGAKKPENI